MTISCVLGKVLLAFGICLVLLSIGTFVDPANANCDSCTGAPMCEAHPPADCMAGNASCTGGVPCFFIGPCKCKTPILDPTRCHCG